MNSMTLPAPTPEGQLIRQARELATPKLSIRAAAARIGMSGEQWGYVERGYAPARGGKPPQPFSPPPATLARMARSLRIPARALAEAGRDDAAAVLSYAPEADEPSGVGALLDGWQRDSGATDLDMLRAVAAWQQQKLERLGS